MTSFPVPARTIPFSVAMIWHPRLDADPPHKWLRERVREVCAGAQDALREAEA